MGRAKEVTYYNGRLRGKYLTEGTCNILDKIRSLDERNGVVSDLKNSIYSLNDEQIDEVIFNRTSDGMDLPLGTLRDSQTIGVAFMFYARRMVLGDSVGLGKTVEIAGLMNLLDAQYKEEGQRNRYLILTDGIVSDQFRREMIRFTGEYVDLITARKDKITEFLKQYPDPNDLPNIVGPSSLLKQPIFQEYLLAAKNLGSYPFNTFVVDESSVLANTKTKAYEGGEAIRNEVENVYLMNATTFESNLSMFYAQLAFTDPTFLPTKTAFEGRYCQKSKVPYSGYYKPNGKYKNQKEFRGLVGYRYLARTRKGLGATMKDCTAELVLLPKSREQTDMLPKTSMPQMVFDNPSYFDEDIQFIPLTTPKLGVIVDSLTGKVVREGGWETARTVLIYCHYKETQEKLREALVAEGIKTEIMNGDTPNDERQSLIRTFKTAGIRVLITNVMKGLNFGECNHSIIYSAPGNVNLLVQFAGRSTRDLDIIDKHLLVLCMEKEEEKRWDEVLRQRAKASHDFAGSDHSLVMSLMLDDEDM